MKKYLQISEDEKQYILKKYKLLNETTKTKSCEGNCINGKGVLTYTNGDVYNGFFENSKREGGGVLTYKSGDIFSGNFKDDKFEGNGLYKHRSGIVYDGQWITDVTTGDFLPIPSPSDGNFTVFWPNSMGGYTYKGFYGTNGTNGRGTFKFPDGTIYTGEFKQDGFESKIVFDGTAEENDGVSISTEDLVDYHNNPSVNGDQEEIKNEPEIIATPDENVVEISEELRKNWPGCNGSGSLKQYFFNGEEGSVDRGYLTKMPELGWAKFKGEIDGKQITIERGCFDKFKILQGKETGERGDFEGAYYTEDTENDFFIGDEKLANKFKFGTLKNSTEYGFYDKTWSYRGNFIDGIINGTIQSKPKNYISGNDLFGTIEFGDGNRYEGDFMDSSIGGYGQFIFKDGMKLNGFFSSSRKEGVVITVTLRDGKSIPDIFKYHDNYVSPEVKPDVDNTIGAIKGSTFKGTTVFTLSLESTKTGKSKNFEKSPLPNVSIRLTNLTDKTKVFQAKSDDSGSFDIKGVTFGKYDLSFIYGNENEGFVFKKEGYQINKDVTTVTVNLKPTKSLQKSLNRDVINFDKSETNEYGRSSLPGSGAETADLLSMSDTEILDYLGYLQTIQSGNKRYPKVTTKELCLKEFKDYANIIRKIYKKEIDPETLKKSGNNLQPTKNFLQACVKDFGDKITNDKDVKLVLAPPGEAYDYGLRLENKNKRDIYIKDMGLSNTINKVIMEHSDNKKRMIQESKILNNKFNFIIENYDLNRKSERKLAFNEIRSERNNLIKLGYDKTLVRESFLEVMKNLFGESGQNPVEDFKKGLSEKLSAPIDLKVLVNEMDASIIENAFNTNAPKDVIMKLLMEKIKEKIEPQIDVVFDNINKTMENFRNAVGGLQV